MSDEAPPPVLVRPNRLKGGLGLLVTLLIVLFTGYHAIYIMGDPDWVPKGRARIWIGLDPDIRTAFGLVPTAFFAIMAVLLVRSLLLPYAGRVDGRGIRAPSFFGWREATWEQIARVERFRKSWFVAGVRFYLKHPKPHWWSRKAINIMTPDGAALIYAALLHPELVPDLTPGPEHSQSPAYPNKSNQP